jgi:hypothetical protein
MPSRFNDDERARRIGANEAVFRELNERIERLNRSLAQISDEMMHAICECGNIECAQPVVVPFRRYEEVRSDPTLFLVVPGHELVDVESIVDEADGYNVVRKIAGVAQDIAEETDPRAD